MARGQMMDHGMDPKLFKRFKAVYTGHYHHKSSKGNIHYMGSPYEMTWADCGDVKGFHVLDTDTLELEFVPNPITLFERVVFSGKPVDVKDKIIKLVVPEGADRKKLDKAIAAMDDALDLQVIDEHLSLDDSAGQAIMVDDIEDTMKMVTDYINASEIDADKDALVGLMKQLYVEAHV
jgi:DNA repair exonuclease SbcCD nuclease subunit